MANTSQVFVFHLFASIPSAKASLVATSHDQKVGKYIPPTLEEAGNESLLNSNLTTVSIDDL